MQKSLKIGISIVTLCVVVGASYSSVVGIQLVKASNDRVINDTLDQKELLFQTIVDMANSKEVQKTILGIELMEKRSFVLCNKFSTSTFPVITENFLKRAYTVGILLSRMLSKSRIHTMLERYQGNDQAMQKGLTAVIEKDTVLKKEITQLSSLSCGCENGNTTWLWPFPIICTILDILINFFGILCDLVPELIGWLVFISLIFIFSEIYLFLQCP